MMDKDKDEDRGVSSNSALLARARASLEALDSEERATTMLRLQAARDLKDVHDRGAYKDEGHETFAAWLATNRGRTTRCANNYLAAAKVDPALVKGRNLDLQRLAVLGRQPPWLQHLLAAHAEALPVAAMLKVAAAAKGAPKFGRERAEAELARQLAGGGKDSPRSRNPRSSRVGNALETVIGAIDRKSVAGLDGVVRGLLLDLAGRLVRAGLLKAGTTVPISEKPNDSEKKRVEKCEFGTRASTAPAVAGPGAPAAAAGLAGESGESGAARADGQDDPDGGAAGLEGEPDEGADDELDGGFPVAEVVAALFDGLDGAEGERLENALYGLLADDNEPWTRQSRWRLQHRCTEVAARGAGPAEALQRLAEVADAEPVEARWPLLFPVFLGAEPPFLWLSLQALALVSRLPESLKDRAARAAAVRPLVGPPRAAPTPTAAEEQAEVAALRARLDHAEAAFMARGGFRQ